MLSAIRWRMDTPALLSCRSISARLLIFEVAFISLCVVGCLFTLSGASALADSSAGEGGCPNESLRAETGRRGSPTAGRMSW